MEKIQKLPYRGKYDLTQENWVLGEEKWDIVYETYEDNKIVNKRIPLDPKNYHLAKVDEKCLFHIHVINGIETAVVNNVEMTINSHLFENIMEKVNETNNRINDILNELVSTCQTSKLYSEEDVIKILKQTLNRLKKR